MTDTSYNNSLARLSNILTELREKCPWDKKQTIHTLSPQSIEELYELMDAIQAENWEHIKEELGDLLLHILFYTKIAEEQGAFGIGEVIQHICDKLIRRHPHIYSNVTVTDEEDVKKNWEQIKLKEGKKSVLEGVAKSAPAMNKAISIQNKVKQVGFDWSNVKDVADKVNEEWQELTNEIDQNNIEHMESEFGDLLFSMLNYARFLNIDPEKALERTNQKFIKRFEYIENSLMKTQSSFDEKNIDELNILWNEAKAQTK